MSISTIGQYGPAVWQAYRGALTGAFTSSGSGASAAAPQPSGSGFSQLIGDLQSYLSNAQSGTTGSVTAATLQNDLQAVTGGGTQSAGATPHHHHHHHSGGGSLQAQAGLSGASPTPSTTVSATTSGSDPLGTLQAAFQNAINNYVLQVGGSVSSGTLSTSV